MLMLASILGAGKPKRFPSLCGNANLFNGKLLTPFALFDNLTTDKMDYAG